MFFPNFIGVRRFTDNRFGPATRIVGTSLSTSSGCTIFFRRLLMFVRNIDGRRRFRPPKAIVRHTSASAVTTLNSRGPHNGGRPHDHSSFAAFYQIRIFRPCTSSVALGLFWVLISEISNRMRTWHFAFPVWCRLLQPQLTTNMKLFGLFQLFNRRTRRVNLASDFHFHILVYHFWHVTRQIRRYHTI